MPQQMVSLSTEKVTHTIRASTEREVERLREGKGNRNRNGNGNEDEGEDENRGRMEGRIIGWWSCQR